MLPAYSQNTTLDTKVNVPLSFVVAAEKAKDELVYRTEAMSAMEAQIAALTSQVSRYVQLEVELTSKIASLETSLANSEKALEKAEANTGLTEQQKQLYVDRMNEYKQELDATRRELRSANSSKKWWALGGTVVGYGLSKTW